jgi:DnaJ-class molecular chaperone
MAEDYYKVLGVSRDASAADIQKAYRNLARKYHPDLHPDDKTAKQKFQEVQQAYDVLNDASKRELYDRYGSSFEHAQAGGRPGGGATWSFEGAEDFDFSQLFGGGAGGFGDLFGQFRRAGGNQKRARRPGRGADLQHELEVPFLAAINGDQVNVQIDRGGKAETLSVKIPPGIEEGKTIRLRGQGQSVDGGPAGDLLITIRVAPHPFYQRSGKNVLMKVPVTLAEAALGARIDIPAPRGAVTVQVPPGTSSGRKLRIRGQGVMSTQGEAGDLLAEIQIALPPTLDEESLELIRQLDSKNPHHPRSWSL